MKSLLQFSLLIFAFAISACETAAPVQEMSDARQAIAVARKAGAADKATQQFREAEAALASAQRKLNQRDYQEARRDAEQAKSMALGALQTSEQLSESKVP